jgi:DNA-binding transcriptional MerR regulator
VGEQEISDLSEGTSGRLTTAELLAAASDSAITARTLEYWRNQGLLPKAERTGQDGKRPQWTYMPQAADQLRALLRFRAKTRNPDILRAALWFEGYPMDLDRVRASMGAVLREFLHDFQKEIARRREQSRGQISQWDAIEQLGRVIARKRGQRSLPRVSRQKQQDRDKAIALSLGLALGDLAATQRLDEEAPLAERMLGLDRARRPVAGFPAWLDGPPGEGLAVFAEFGSLPSLIETVESAGDEELHASRSVARITFDGITALARIADAFAGTENAIGLAALKGFQDDPFLRVWLPPFIIAAGRSASVSEGLSEVTGNLSEKILPLDRQARELAALPDDQLQQRLPGLSKLPYARQARLKRLILEYRGSGASGRHG